MTDPGLGTSAELPPDLGALEDSITPQAWESRAAWVLAEAETEPERAAARTALESLHLRDEPGTRPGRTPARPGGSTTAASGSKESPAAP